ncbi:MAG: hypothetical protein HYY84_12330 [Deltaproteobacteria bacterium]|nr:hypothetical protein [Deltaproteobacteria bacterium]
MNRHWNESSWITEVRANGVSVVAKELGFDVSRQGVSPCPACDATQRGGADRRGPVGLRPDDNGWCCFVCDARGDAVTFAAYHVTGEARPHSEAWRTIRERLAEVDLCESEDPAKRNPWSTLATRRHAPQIKREEAPQRPSQAEVNALWDRCVGVTCDDDASAWLRSRRLDPPDVEDLDLARVIGMTTDLPWWARFRGRPWTGSSHRLLVPMFDSTGNLVSLHARAVGQNVSADAKGAHPVGAEVRRTVMADPLARLLLAGAALADGRSAAEFVRNCRGGLRSPSGFVQCGLFVAEGVPDFLTQATGWSDADEDAPAVIGIVAGSWTPEIAARVPDGTEVVVATHADDAGDKYAEIIRGTLVPRCRLQRWRVTQTNVDREEAQ